MMTQGRRKKRKKVIEFGKERVKILISSFAFSFCHCAAYLPLFPYGLCVFV